MVFSKILKVKIGRKDERLGRRGPSLLVNEKSRSRNNNRGSTGGHDHHVLACALRALNSASGPFLLHHKAGGGGWPRSKPFRGRAAPCDSDSQIQKTQRRGSCSLTGCFGGGLEKEFWCFVRESYFIFIQGGLPLNIILPCQPKQFSNKRKMQLKSKRTNLNLTCLYYMLFMFTASVRKWCESEFVGTVYLRISRHRRTYCRYYC